MSNYPGIDGCKLTIYFNNTRVAAEVLNATADDHVFTFDNTPVSTRNLRLIGTVGADSEFIVNFDLEPISGTLTIDAALPAYDSVTARYFYYTNLTDGFDILTQNYKVVFPQIQSEVDIFGQPRYQERNNYPHKVTFDVILSNEVQRNLLTESMFYGYHFIVLDRNIGAEYGLRAYEGPIWSDEQGSIYKGRPFFLPITLMVQQFGNITLGVSGLIVSAQNPGGGKVRFTAPYHGLSTGDTVTVSGTTSYDDDYVVTRIDDNVFEVTAVYVASERGRYLRNDSINWGFWES